MFKVPISRKRRDSVATFETKFSFKNKLKKSEINSISHLFFIFFVGIKVKGNFKFDILNNNHSADLCCLYSYYRSN